MLAVLSSGNLTVGEDEVETATGAGIPPVPPPPESLFDNNVTNATNGTSDGAASEDATGSDLIIIVIVAAVIVVGALIVIGLVIATKKRQDKEKLSSPHANTAKVAPSPTSATGGSQERLRPPTLDAPPPTEPTPSKSDAVAPGKS